MSSDDLLDDILEPEKSQAVGGGLRSRADEIVDAVKQSEVDDRYRGCPKCGSAKIRKIRPLGGGVFRIKCRDCKKEFPVGGVPVQCIEKPKQLPHGAYYTNAEKPIGVDKHTPKHRIKGRGKRNG